MNGSSWNRRTFLTDASLTAVAAAAAPRLLYANSIVPPIRGSKPFLACVSSSLSGLGSAHQMAVYHVQDGEWRPLNKPITSEAPRSLAIHPAQCVIYVAHDTLEYLGLPRASVSAFALDPSSGALLLLNRVALTLTATCPQHISVSPDGGTLLVSASGGGSYNVFRLAGDGSILPGGYALKQTGCGPHSLQSSAHPRASVFQKSGLAAFACDFGSDRIDQIDFTGEAPAVTSRASFAPGSGPSHLALHPSGGALVIANHLRPSLQVFTVDPTYSHLGASIQQLPLDALSAGPLCFGPSGDDLYATGVSRSRETVLFSFQMDRASFHLRPIARKDGLGAGRPRQLMTHGSDLFLVGDTGVRSLRLDRQKQEPALRLAFQQVLRKSYLSSMVISTL
ncbi:MAG: lactonase family protein [Acidobacteriota bacterium]|nr:lactonase family protein [Acidobacteriota bacterium]